MSLRRDARLSVTHWHEACVCKTPQRLIGLAEKIHHFHGTLIYILVPMLRVGTQCIFTARSHMRDLTSLDAGPIAVVDPDVSDYDALFTPDLRLSLRVRFFDTGREALRDARLHRTAAWIVSVELADMTGFDLVEMLRDKLHPSLIWMIASRYRAEDEIRAYRSGATMYACKPLDAQWLQEALRGCLERTQTLSPSIPE